jgi:hypothetical protein
MSYCYEFDETSLRDYNTFSVESYSLILEGLQALLRRVQEWNAEATARGVKQAPYEREARDLAEMISWGHQEMRKRSPRVSYKRMSVGTMRYLRAGVEFLAMTRRADLSREEGWPAAALKSVEQSLEALEELAERLKVKPSEILSEVLSQGERGAAVQQRRRNVPGFH